MTIHTFEVTARVTNDNYYKIQADLKSNDLSKWEATPNGMHYWGLSHKGIFITMYTVKKKDFYTYYILYRISARRVIENDNFVGLFNTDNYSELEEAVNTILKEKSAYLPLLKKSKLKRLDFCINAEFENHKQVKAYIKTVKRANIPSNLDLFTKYDKTAKRMKPSKNDFTVEATDYISVSIYNKYAEMKQQKSGVFPKSEIEKSKNIVRIEIRCKKEKIAVLKKKYNIATISEFMKFGDKIGDYLYNYYLGKIFNNGGVYTLKEALKRVDMSEYRTKVIKLLKEFLRDCNTSRSVADTIKTYKKIYGKEKAKKIIEQLDNIETSFVTVTAKDEKIFNNYIPTPLELYKEFVE